MENEIMEMTNEEVVTDVTEVVSNETGNGWKIAAGIGLAALAGVVIYKVGKKIVTKIKAKKESIEDIECDECDYVVNDDVDSEEEAE